MDSDLVARLSEDLDALAASLRRAGVAPDDAARLLGLASAAVVDAVALRELRHAADGPREPRRVHTLGRDVEPQPAQPPRVLLA